MAIFRERVSEWRVHIGAHKTATTHLQDTLAAQRGALKGHGIDYLPREQARALGLARGVRRIARKKSDFLLRQALWPMTMTIARQGPAVFAISEENFLGGVDALGVCPFYPNATSQIATLTNLLQPAPLHLFLSLRDYATLFSSVYIQRLRQGPVKGGAERMLKQWTESPPSWPCLVRRIQAAAPRAEVSVWTFEDYAEHPTQIMSAFLGGTPIEDLQLPPPPETKALSRSAVLALEGLPPSLSRGERKKAVRNIENAKGCSERYRPLPRDVHDWLSQKYADDLEIIRKSNVNWIRPLAEVRAAPSNAPADLSPALIPI